MILKNYEYIWILSNYIFIIIYSILIHNIIRKMVRMTFTEIAPAPLH